MGNSFSEENALLVEAVDAGEIADGCEVDGCAGELGSCLTCFDDAGVDRAELDGALVSLDGGGAVSVLGDGEEAEALGVLICVGGGVSCVELAQQGEVVLADAVEPVASVGCLLAEGENQNVVVLGVELDDPVAFSLAVLDDLLESFVQLGLFLGGGGCRSLASVAASVAASVGAVVGASAKAKVGASVGAVVGACVGAVVGACVGAAVGA